MDHSDIRTWVIFIRTFFPYKSSIFGFELLKDISNEFERKKMLTGNTSAYSKWMYLWPGKTTINFVIFIGITFQRQKREKNTSLSKSLWPFLLDYFCHLHKMTNDSTLIVVSRCLLNATDIFVASTPNYGTWSLIVRASCGNVQNLWNALSILSQCLCLYYVCVEQR